MINHLRTGVGSILETLCVDPALGVFLVVLPFPQFTPIFIPLNFINHPHSVSLEPDRRKWLKVVPIGFIQ